jgi:hypothetical protein
MGVKSSKHVKRSVGNLKGNFDRSLLHQIVISCADFLDKIKKENLTTTRITHFMTQCTKVVI